MNDPIANLTDEDWREIEHLNARIQSHAGPWGGWGGSQEISPGVRQMPFAEPDPLVWEFEQSWYRWHLVLTDLNWPAWSEGRQWYSAPDPAKYDRLDRLTALKLLTAVIRNNRFNEGALMGAFESGDFPKIIDRFVRLRTAALPADAVPVQGDGSLVIRHRTGLSRVTVLPHHFSHALAARLGHEAVEAIEKGSYRGPDGQQVDWADEVRAAVRAKESIPSELPLAVPEPSSSATVVEVTNESTLEAARRLTDAGKKPLVLNFANGVHPGGGFLSGARAQEEALCRSSALWATLAGDPMYGAHARRALPDSTDWAIISPGVPVFRTDDGDTLTQTWLADFITCAAPYAPRVPKADELLAKRLLRILNVASARGYSAPVLGAWGLGAFKNDPAHFAQRCREALAGRYAGVFELVVFAIVGRAGDGHNLDVFLDEFPETADAPLDGPPPTTLGDRHL